MTMAALFVALTSLDSRVPERVTRSIDAFANGRWASSGVLGHVLWSVTSTPALDNYFVLGMFAAGVVLVFLMVRT